MTIATWIAVLSICTGRTYAIDVIVTFATFLTFSFCWACLALHNGWVIITVLAFDLISSSFEKPFMTSLTRLSITSTILAFLDQAWSIYIADTRSCIENEIRFTFSAYRRITFTSCTIRIIAGKIIYALIEYCVKMSRELALVAAFSTRILTT